MEKVVTLAILGSLIAAVTAVLFAAPDTTAPPAATDDATGNAVAPQSGITGVQDGQEDSPAALLVRLGCTACHSARSLGIEGGDRGPDLSGSYFRVAAWYGVRPPSPSVEADEAVARFLLDPPSWAPTMQDVVSSLRATYGEDYAKIYVPELVRALRKAAEIMMHYHEQCGQWGGVCSDGRISGVHEDWRCCQRGPIHGERHVHLHSHS